MKINKIVAILFIVAMIGGIMVFINDKNKDITVEDLKKNPIKHGELLEVSYSKGGGMLGEHSSISLAKDRKSGAITYTTSKSEMHSIPLRCKVYEVNDNDCLNKLKEYIDEYNLSAYKDLPQSDLIAMDAPSTNLRLVFNDESVGGIPYSVSNISYDLVFPDGGYDVLNNFMKMVNSYADYNRIIERYILIDGEKVYWGKDITNTHEEIEGLVTGYFENVENNIYYDANGIDSFMLTYTGENSDSANREFVLMKELENEYAEYDCSWMLEYAEKENPDTIVKLTLHQDNLYLIENDKVLVFER